jgi:2-C-methyl-D-erythritol 4-phosphate cytidylyltransferase
MAPRLPRIAAVVAAAGRGERLNCDIPKAFQLLGGLPLVAHAVSAVGCAPSVELVVVAVPASHVGRAEALLVGHHGDADLRVVEGAASRHESVAQALSVLPPTVEMVLVHDAARPLVPVSLVETVAAAVRAGAPAVVPAVAVTDTIRRVEAGVVRGVVDRSMLRAMQTPQGFVREVLDRAYAAALDLAAVTDDASLVERLGIPVTVVPGHDDAFKVTRPLDLLLAEAILAKRQGRV